MSFADNMPPTPISAVDAFFLFASIFNILFDGFKSGLPDKPPSKQVGFFKFFGFIVVLVAIRPDTLFSSQTFSISITLFLLRSGAILIKMGTCLVKETLMVLTLSNIFSSASGFCKSLRLFVFGEDTFIVT